MFDRHIAPLLTRYCAGCHGGDAPKADLRLELRSEEEARKIAAEQGEVWGKVVDELSAKHMPPARAK